MRAIVNRQRYTEGTGKSKKEARQNAAKNALDGLKSTQNTEPVSTNMLYRLEIVFILCVCVCIYYFFYATNSTILYFDWYRYTFSYTHVFMYLYIVSA